MKPPGTNTWENRCFVYNRILGSWSVSGTMPKKVSHSAYTTHPVLGLFMVGGIDGDSGGTEGNSFVISTTSGENFKSDHQAYSNSVRNGCAVTIDDDRIMVVGGAGGSAIETHYNYAHVFSVSAGTWSPAGTMSTKRNYPGCGLVSDPVTGAPIEVVVAGGRDETGQYHDSIDIYTIGGGWTRGRPANRNHYHILYTHTFNNRYRSPPIQSEIGGQRSLHDELCPRRRNISAAGKRLDQLDDGVRAHWTDLEDCR